MKILHCADLHLDSKMETHLSTDKAKKRRFEILNTFEKMVEYANNNGINIIIIAGDMFDTTVDNQKTIKKRVLDIITKNSNIDFLYLQGNHDKDTYFKSLDNKPSNLKLFTNEWTSYKYENVNITGIEFIDRDSSNIYDELVLFDNDFNIVVMHGQISKYGNDNKGEIVYLNKLQGKYIDYLALGHIHKHVVDDIDNRGKYCYSGCLEGRGFDECGEKGFVVIDINNKDYDIQFVPFSTRIMHEVIVDISEIKDEFEIIDIIEEKISDIPEKDMVKVVLEGEVDENIEPNIDIDYIKSKFEDRFYFFKIKSTFNIKIDYLKYEHDISFKGEYIRQVKKLDIDEATKNKMVQQGIRAILGKEV